MASFVHCLNDLSGLQCDKLQGGVVIDGQGVDGFVAGEADDSTRHTGIRYRRPVSKKIAIKKEMATKIGYIGCLGIGGHFPQMLVQIVVYTDMAGLSN